MKKIKLIILVLISVNSIYTAPSLYEQGENARRAGNTSEARKHYFRFFTRNPNSELAPMAMFRYALSNVPYNDAVSYLNRILKQYPNYSEKDKIYEQLAMLHYLREKYVECIRALDNIIKYPRANNIMKQKANYYIGKSYFLIGNSNRAKHFYNQIISNGKTNYVSLAKLEIGEIYFKDKNYTEAQNLYEDIIREYPESEAELKAVYRLGLIYSFKKDKEKSKAAFSYIIQSYPVSIEAGFAKAKLIELNKGIFPVIEDEGFEQRRETSRDISQRDNFDENQEDINDDINESEQDIELTERENNGKLAIHIGNYRARNYALKLLNSLKRNGFNAYIIERKISNKKFYTLRVGHYESRTQAEQIARQITSRLKLRVSIIDRT